MCFSLKRISRFSNDHQGSCPLCDKENESTIHLFAQCDVARASWFGSYRGVKIEELRFENQNHLVEFIINPPKSLLADQEQKSCFTLYGALLMDLIWKMRNKVVHEYQLMICVEGLIDCS
jgi:hypothetical protein